MISAKLIWPPYPYAAGFCVTDDPDAATFEQTKAVYDYLISRSFVTTKPVWPFAPTAPSGIPPTPNSTVRGITLQDSRVLFYCQELGRRGFEICLHGASAGNNKREKTLEAFDFLTRNSLGSDTFICHSKNAENIYWGDKSTSLFPFHALVRLYNRHAFSGEVPENDYFWGDLCASRINQIRLLRTRCTNTLKRNPSMPYFDKTKPFVNGWFSATKRSFADCASPEALDRLKREHGMTILYQYLFRYADPSTLRLNEAFVRSVDMIASDHEIMVATLSTLMKRLRLLQGTFVTFEGRSFWLINANDEDVCDLQIALSQAVTVEDDGNARSVGRIIHVKNLPAGKQMLVRASGQIRFADKNAVPMGGGRQVTWYLPSGRLRANLGQTEWHTPEGTDLTPGSFLLQSRRSGTGLRLLSELPAREEAVLVLDQIFIILREIALKGRSLRTDRHLESSRTFALEDHETW